MSWTALQALAVETLVRSRADRDGFDPVPLLVMLGLLPPPRSAPRPRRTTPRRLGRLERSPQVREPLTPDELEWMVEQGYAQVIAS